MKNTTTHTLSSEGTLNLEELAKRVIFAAKKQRNTILVGFPGVGKSQWIEAIFKAIGYDYISYIPSMGNPSHINGLPFNDEGKAKFLLYEFMEKIMASTKPTIVHIEDLIQAAPLMQASLMSVVHKREVNGKKIPDCVSFIMDTNDASHRAGGNQIIAPMLSRASIFTFPVDVKGWIKWGLESGRISREIILYIHAHPDSLCANKVPKGIESYATPRTWELASEYVTEGFTDAVTLASCVGPEEGHNCAAFLTDLEKYGNMLPKILKNPDTAPMLKEMSEIYGVLLILANHFEKKNVPAIVKYFKRYKNNELTSVLFNVGCQIHPDSKETKEYIKQNVDSK